MISYPSIPTYITVHLGAYNNPNAANVTVPFADYIKNVASGEIYPTWPESAIRANIYAQISFALNKIYLEYYRIQGYNFDITSSTATDQSYSYGRNIFENISQIVDEIFNSYIQKEGFIEPFAAKYCNGTTTTCNGLSQWGTVDRANEGLVPYEILRYYYGDDIILRRDVTVEDIEESYPGTAFRQGDTSPYIGWIKIELNIISLTYTEIPKIVNLDDYFDENTYNAIVKFQKISNLVQDGIVGKATWYQIAEIFIAIRRLTEIDSVGIRMGEFPTSNLTSAISRNDIELVQYYLSIISFTYPQIPHIEINGELNSETRNAICAFQKLNSLPCTGELDGKTYSYLYGTYTSVAESYDKFREFLPVEFLNTGNIYKTYSMGDADQRVRDIQNRLNVINKENIIAETGFFGPKTKQEVAKFQLNSNLPVSGTITPETYSAVNRQYYAFAPSITPLPTQYPGYIMKLDMTDNVLKADFRTLTTPIESLQKMLRSISLSALGNINIVPNGKFDLATKDAVIAVQSISSVPATGEVDFKSYEIIKRLNKR